MKKILAIAIGAAVVASLASAQTYSKNAVGFISIEAKEAKQFIPLSVPFVRVNSDENGGIMDFADFQFATDAPERSKVYFFENQGWKSYTKDGDVGDPWEDVDHVMKAGELFFLQPFKPMTIVMTGQVPADPVMDVEILKGKMYSAIANPYPYEMDLATSELGKNAPERSRFHVWTGNGWQAITKDGDEGDDFEDAPVLTPGTGVFFQGAASSDIENWEVEKLYNWP